MKKKTETTGFKIPRDAVVAYRIYADGRITHEDDFNEDDNSLPPYYDDYETVEVPEDLIDFIVEGEGVVTDPKKLTYRECNDLLTKCQVRLEDITEELLDLHTVTECEYHTVFREGKMAAMKQIMLRTKLPVPVALRLLKATLGHPNK